MADLVLKDRDGTAITYNGVEVISVPNTDGGLDHFLNLETGGIPSGGTDGQVLKKISETDYDVGWEDDVDITGKADKVIDATADNFASLDENGNLKDSGKKATDFEVSDETILKQADVVDDLTTGGTNVPLSAERGKSIKQEVDVLKDRYDDISNIDFGEWIDDYFIFASNGNAGYYAGYCCTDFVQICGIKKIKTFASNYIGENVGIAFYEANSNSSFISGIDLSSYNNSIEDFDVPNTANYLRITSWMSQKESFILKGIYLSESIINAVKESRNNYNTLYEYTKINLGTLVDGFVNSKYGWFSSVTSYKQTGYVPLQATKIAVTITFSAANVGFAFYNNHKRIISGFDGTAYAIGDEVIVDVPEDARYFATCALNAYADLMQVRLLEYASAICKSNENPCFYTGGESSVFDNILCIGDSLTEGAFDYYTGSGYTGTIITKYSYPTLLKAMTGRNTTNKGDSGESTKTWWEKHSTDDLSGHDACIIELGLNDIRGSVGVLCTSAERITALTNIINKVKTENPNIKIFLSSLFNTYTGADVDSVNADIQTVVASNTDCYYMDIHTYGKIIKKVTGDISETAGHLTAIGYRKLAMYYYNYMSYIINNNLNSFAFVQFIGTDKSYT